MNRRRFLRALVAAAPSLAVGSLFRGAQGQIGGPVWLTVKNPMYFTPWDREAWAAYRTARLGGSMREAMMAVAEVGMPSAAAMEGAILGAMERGRKSGHRLLGG